MAEPTQAQILAALQAPRPIRPAVQTYADADAASALVDAEGKNRAALLCVREGCRCEILEAGAANLVVGSGGVFPPSALFPPPSLPSSAPSSPSAPPVPSPAAYWAIRGSPLSFSNATFSKAGAATGTVPPGAPGAGGTLKWVACGDCEEGPVGWTIEGGTEAWVAVERVAYRLDIKRSASSSPPGSPPPAKKTKARAQATPRKNKGDAAAAGTPSPPKSGWTNDKKAAFLDDIIAAGAKAANLDDLAAKYGLTKSQLVDQVKPNRSNVRQQAVAAVNGG
ncbi:hypothetical protein Q5752_001343 [Cryptotrichosporon argae]